MHARAQAGVGLIEVLIALVILSLGMLGMAGLQMWSLKSNQGSMERGMAVMQTHTIADAMRAARTSAMANGFDVAPNAAIGTGRTAYATAALTQWRQSLLDNLGVGASGGVDCDGARCEITILWQDRQPGPAEDNAEDEEGEDEEGEDEEGEGEEPATQRLTTVVFL